MIWKSGRKTTGGGCDDPDVASIAAEADETVYNLIHLIYHARSFEGASKDYEFSRRTMVEHWNAGYEDTALSLAEPKVLQRPDSEDGMFVCDLGRRRNEEVEP